MRGDGAISKPLVLVVDDESTIRKNVSATLREEEYDLVETGKGSEALEASTLAAVAGFGRAAIMLPIFVRAFEIRDAVHHHLRAAGR